MKYGDCVANLRHCFRFPSLLSFLEFLDIPDILERQVSLCLPNLQGNSGVLGLLMSRRVSLYLTNLSDRVLWVSPDSSTQSDRRPGSLSSALTLPRSCCLLLVLASFSPSFWCSWSRWKSERSRESWNGWCKTDKEDCSTHRVWNSLLSIRLQVGVWCRHTWFEFWDPDYFCQTTNQEQLCGFWTHVSLLDFGFLITASLPSKMYSIAPRRENFAFDGTQ